MSRLYSNFAEGTLTSGLAPADLTMDSAEFDTWLPTIAAPDEMWVILDPDGPNPEIVAITSFAGGNTATIRRSEDGTSPQTHANGIDWKCDVVSGGLRGLADGSLIDDDAITEDHLQIDSVNQAQLQDGIVGPNELAANAVVGTKIANLSIVNDHIVDGTIEQVKLAGGGGSVPADSITTVEVVNGSLLGADIQPGGIGATELASAPGQISNVHISDTAAISQTKLDLAIEGTDIAPDAIDSTHIQQNAVGGSEWNEGSSLTAANLTSSGLLTVQGGTGTIYIDGNTFSHDSDMTLTSNNAGADTIIQPQGLVYCSGGPSTGLRLRSNDVRLDETTNVLGADTMVRESGNGRITFIISQRQYKKNIVDLALDVSALQPRQFDANDNIEVEDGIGTSEQIAGFIAEEAHEADPRFCYADPDGTPRSINWNAVTAALVVKVQQLEAQLA